MPLQDLVTINADEWAAYVQPDGPNTAPVYLPCHDVDDIENDEGDIELKFRPDPARAGAYLKSGAIKQEPSPGTVTITGAIQRLKDVLANIEAGCPVPIYLTDVCGRRDVFDDWESQVIAMFPAFRTNTTRSGIGKKSPGDNDEAMRAFAFSFVDVFEPFKPLVSRLANISETAALNGIDVCGTPKCTNACGPGRAVGQDLVVVGDAAAGSPSDTAAVWDTGDSGQSWSASATAPFAAAEDVAAVICVPIGGDTFRRIAVRGETDAGNPAEIAYSDDDGATWTNVDVGSVTGQYAPGGGQSIIATEDGTRIWLVTSGGYIYRSTDKGLTWTAQHSAGLTSQDLYGVNVYGKNTVVACGAADALLKSEDGGVSWSLMTATGGGVTLRTIFPVNKSRYFVGDAAGNLYYTEDGGTTYRQRGFSGDGAGTVPAIEFANELQGFMLHNSAAPVGAVLYTVNGGYSWKALTTPTNAGLNDLVVVAPDKAYAVGEPQGSKPVILKIAPEVLS